MLNIPLLLDHHCHKCCYIQNFLSSTTTAATAATATTTTSTTGKQSLTDVRTRDDHVHLQQVTTTLQAAFQLCKLKKELNKLKIVVFHTMKHLNKHFLFSEIRFLIH